MKHKLSMNSFHSFIHWLIFKIPNMLEIKCWREKNIDWSHFKLIITNFMQVSCYLAILPYSTPFTPWDDHPSLLPLNLQNLLPLLSLSNWSCSLLHWKNKSKRTYTGSHLGRYHPISMCAHVLCLLSSYIARAVWLQVKSPSSIFLKTMTLVTAQSCLTSSIFPFLLDFFHQHTNML